MPGTRRLMMNRSGRLLNEASDRHAGEPAVHPDQMSKVIVKVGSAGAVCRQLRSLAARL